MKIMRFLNIFHCKTQDGKLSLPWLKNVQLGNNNYREIVHILCLLGLDCTWEVINRKQTFIFAQNEEERKK